jgi:hypothetical protein
MTRLTVNKKEAIKIISTKFLSLILLLSFVNCKNLRTANQESAITPVSCHTDPASGITEAMEDGLFKAHQSTSPVQIDGCSQDAIWSQVNWYEMNYLWMGNRVDSIDYHGRFKLAWDHQYVYILVEVIDEKLNPTLEDGVENYWKGDYVEVFIDEDQSGGNHQYNHQAFAYHVSTEGHAIDKNTLQETVFFDDHVNVVRSHDGNTYYWEMAIKLYDKQFDENSNHNIPVKISAQKMIGFSIAYGDNDGKHSRENFMGSKKTHGNNNDEGYINSDVFGSILFVE